MVFCDFSDFFWSGAPLSGNPAVECQKLKVFCDFFLVGCTPLRENEGRVSKTGVFLRFWGSRNCPENCAHDSFCLFFFLRLPNGQYGPVSQLSRSEKCCTGPFNWGEAHCAGEKVKR